MVCFGCGKHYLKIPFQVQFASLIPSCFSDATKQPLCKFQGRRKDGYKRFPQFGQNISSQLRLNKLCDFSRFPPPKANGTCMVMFLCERVGPHCRQQSPPSSSVGGHIFLERNTGHQRNLKTFQVVWDLEVVGGLTVLFDGFGQ